MAESTHDVLQRHFGFREFLEGQEAVLSAALEGHDVVNIMPTGGGKSLCYQLPALMLDGITIVVSPLIALMKDQVDSLIRKNIAATYINSSLAPQEVEKRIQSMKLGQYRLIYIAPERFKSEHFVRALAPLSIALFALDEAHCISQWGHDFRPDYLRLKHALVELGQPQVMALTATATPEVREDIVEQLGLGKHGREAPKMFTSGFARHNLTLGVTQVKNNADKLARITEFVNQLKTGIVYCSTRKNVEKVAKHLAELRIPHIAYHAGMKDDQRTKAQEKFMSGKCAVAVATNAFGMGIDRADLRFVIHHDIPGSIEAYYQEAGRAGRDGEPSRCELLFNYADVQTQEFFIEGANPTRQIIAGLYRALTDLCCDGPIEMPISEIAEMVSEANNDMAIGSALHLLVRAGFIQRDYRQGSRTYTTRIIEAGKALEDLPIDFARLDTKRKRDFAKLSLMIRYADNHGCRHQYILKYFGDEEVAEHCTICDTCLSKVHSTSRVPTDEEMVIIQKALSCVARLNGRFGRGRIAQALVGSRSKEVLDAGLDQLSTYGLLSTFTPDYVWSLLDTLIRAGCIQTSSGEYPTLSLTEMGSEVMRRQRTINLHMPTVEAIQTKAKGKRKTTSAPREDLGDCDMALLEALRKWRRDKSSMLGNIPAYLVYADKTLVELAQQKPDSEAALLNIRGIGPAKAMKFGEETLEVIERFRNRD